MFQKNTDQITYDIEFYHDRTYQVDMFLPLKGSFFKKIYDISRPKIQSKTGIKINDTFQESGSFEIPEIYLNSIRTFISARFKKKVIAKYNIRNLCIKNYKIKCCKFIKKDIDWQIVIEIVGDYSDNR